MKCIQCNNEFSPKYKNKSKPLPKYCSHKCHGEHSLGRKFSNEHKQKLREAKFRNPTRYWLGRKRPMMAEIGKRNTGKRLSEEHKKKISLANVGRIHTLEARRKMSESQKGSNASNWKGGISKVYKRIRAGLKFRLWRDKVFKRDEYICRRCKKKGGYLHPHHIENFAEHPTKRFLIKNGVTLCKPCHSLFHKQFGFRNNNKNQITRFTNDYS